MGFSEFIRERQFLSNVSLWDSQPTVERLRELLLAHNGAGCGLHRFPIIARWSPAGVQCVNELVQKLSELFWVWLIRDLPAELFPLFVLVARKHRSYRHERCQS
jgi:hypothetical protein